jgi:hypothetical protein
VIQTYGLPVLQPSLAFHLHVSVILPRPVLQMQHLQKKGERFVVFLFPGNEEDKNKLGIIQLFSVENTIDTKFSRD